MDWTELLENPALIERSSLQRVVAIGAGRVVNGVVVELLSLEARDLGGFGLMQIEIPASPDREPSLFGAEIRMHDDIGGRYQTSEASGLEGNRLGELDSLVSRLRFAYAPALMSGARTMIVRILRLHRSVHPFHAADTIEGPWEFTVPLV